MHLRGSIVRHATHGYLHTIAASSDAQEMKGQRSVRGNGGGCRGQDRRGGSHGCHSGCTVVESQDQIQDRELRCTMSSDASRQRCVARCRRFLCARSLLDAVGEGESRPTGSRRAESRGCRRCAVVALRQMCDEEGDGRRRRRENPRSVRRQRRGEEAERRRTDERHAEERCDADSDTHIATHTTPHHVSTRVWQRGGEQSESEQRRSPLLLCGCITPPPPAAPSRLFEFTGDGDAAHNSSEH